MTQSILPTSDEYHAIIFMTQSKPFAVYSEVFSITVLCIICLNVQNKFNGTDLITHRNSKAGKLNL